MSNALLPNFLRASARHFLLLFLLLVVDVSSEIKLNEKVSYTPSQLNEQVQMQRGAWNKTRKRRSNSLHSFSHTGTGNAAATNTQEAHLFFLGTGSALKWKFLRLPIWEDAALPNFDGVQDDLRHQVVVAKFILVPYLLERA